MKKERDEGLDKINGEIKILENEMNKVIGETRKKLESLEMQKELFKKIQEVIPDVKISWWHGCAHKYKVHGSPIFESESVNKDFDEISFGGLGCCNEGYVDPYYARAIKIVDGQRVRGSKKTRIATYDDDYYGYNPVHDWKERILDANGEKAIPIIEEFFQKHPYVEMDDRDDCD